MVQKYVFLAVSGLFPCIQYMRPIPVKGVTLDRKAGTFGGDLTILNVSTGWEFYQGFESQKSKSPLFPGGGA